MGKKKKNNAKRGGNRFFRWIRSDLPDEEDKKSPVLLLGVNKIGDSPFLRRRSSDGAHTSGSIKFFRPPKSKYTRGLHGDERLEKIRQDLLTHKHGSDKYKITEKAKDKRSQDDERPRADCIKLNCVSRCVCKRQNSSNRGSFSFHRPENRQSSLCPSEPYGVEAKSSDQSENDIEFKYTEHNLENQPSSSKPNSYNVTPKSTERRSLLLANLNERFRKTLSLDSRKVETNRVLSLPQETRPKSLVNTSNICVQQYNNEDFQQQANFSKGHQPKKKRKSFFSLDTFFDSKKSDTSSIDDYCSSKYKRFELESDDSPLFRRDLSSNRREKTPDLLKLPTIIDSVRKRQSDTRRQLEKLENHFYKSLTKVEVAKTVIDAVPKDAKDIQGTSGHSNHLYVDEDDVEYIEPIRSNFTSQSTLILDKNIPQDYIKPDSILTINTEETEIRLPSSTISPKSGAENDLDSIGPYEIEVKESDLLLDLSRNLTVKVMDKSVDSIGSCSLDVDASTDFSDTTSGSLNILTPSSTTSRNREFTSRIQERASVPRPSLNQTPTVTPVRTPENLTPTPRPLDPAKKSDNLLKPPPKVVVNDSTSHRSRSHHKKRDDAPNKKPSYLNLACSVNGYTNLTTYDSKLRQDINRSREASPIRPITHTYQYKSESNSLLVPVPVSANKLLVPTFGPHDTRVDLTAAAPSKAHTEPCLATPAPHAFMANENKQLKNEFLGPSMTTASTRPYMSSESKTFAASMLHQADETDNVKETFKSSYSENNYRKSNGSKVEIVSAESYTISSNGHSKRVEITKENGEKLSSPMKSFIQQRVERLYGPGALAQGFFNQKRHKTKSQCEEAERTLTERYHTPRKSMDTVEYTDYSSPSKSDLNCSLPVLRHLRPEFRAQLPIHSPKKSPKADSPPTERIIPVTLAKTEPAHVTNGVSALKLDDSSVLDDSTSLLDDSTGVSRSLNGVNGKRVKDGIYFLELEKKETDRLLAMSASVEKELEILQNNPDVSEEVLGFLRSAAGKARLLATQKMQQFQGLCYNNINESADVQYPTTCEDLQGFWDMVCLQVANVDALYEQMRELKAKGWRESAPPAKKSPTGPSQPVPRATTKRAATTARNEKARLAAEKREADRKALLEHRRRVAREMQMVARAAAPGTSQERQQAMAIEGSQEVEIFVGRAAKPTKVAPKGDCVSTELSDDSNLDES